MSDIFILGHFVIWFISYYSYHHNHDILLRKLSNLGITGTSLKWFKNYLLDRKQFVLVENFNSTLLSILTGVPQGSILGPLLFSSISMISLFTQNFYLTFLQMTQHFLILHLAWTNFSKWSTMNFTSSAHTLGAINYHFTLIKLNFCWFYTTTLSRNLTIHFTLTTTIWMKICHKT